jgi:PhnB protein
LIIRDACRAIEFYRLAFGASEKLRLEEPNGRIAHAELVFGDSLVMISEESPERGNPGPETLGGSPVPIHLYVEDVDAMTARAMELGAEILIPVADQFYGDRSGRLRDPFGHVWVISTHVEEMEPAEMERRFQEFVRQQSGADPKPRGEP